MSTTPKFKVREDTLLGVMNNGITLEQLKEKIINMNVPQEEFNAIVAYYCASSKEGEEDRPFVYSLAGEYDLLITHNRIHVIEFKETYYPPSVENTETGEVIDALGERYRAHLVQEEERKRRRNKCR